MDRLPRHKYTKKQMLLLARKMEKYLSLGPKIAHCIRSYYRYRMGICTRGPFPQQRPLWYDNFEDYFRLRLPRLYKVMYKTPFEKLPFHLNHRVNVVNTLVEWRLEIGR